MTAVRSEAPPERVKGKGRQNQSSTFTKLADIKADDAEAEGYDGWYDLGVRDKPATASQLARGITRAHTPAAAFGDQKCPEGRWEAGVTATKDGALVQVRYLGSVEEEDPFT